MPFDRDTFSSIDNGVSWERANITNAQVRCGLEADVGTRLFDRTPTGLVPTVAGQDLVDTAQQMETAVHAAEDAHALGQLDERAQAGEDGGGACRGGRPSARRGSPAPACA